MKIAMLWHGDSMVEEYWNCPLGLSFAFKRLGHNVDIFKFDAANCDLEKFFIVSNNYDFIWVSWPWNSKSLDEQLKKLRTISHKKIILEMGDEPQTFGQGIERAKIADAIYTPDIRCQKKYIEMGINAHWITHWGDEYLFEHNSTIPRSNICVTTCGVEKYTKYLSSALGSNFIYRKKLAEENNEFYNSGTIAFQYARWDEITRRIFEAGGCKLAVVTNRISTATGIYDMFVDGKDILYYDTEQDAAEKIKYLINNEYIRNVLSENIYKKINLYHRAEKRANQIIGIIT
jgi:glycosyltransferase involved in cell wall biosynthesis